MSKTEETLTINKYTAAKWLIGIVIVVIVIIGWFWWHVFDQNSTRVFWGMIDNNLASVSVTKHDITNQQGSSTDQYTQIQFGAVNASHNLSTVKQQGNTVTSETIGTPKNDYSRYLHIVTGQKTTSGKAVNASNFTGIWGKTPSAVAGQPPSVQYFQQSVLGVMPFGNFNVSQRRALIKLIRDNNTYSLGPVVSSKVGGRSVYVYNVNISPEGLIKMLVQYTQDLGLGNVGLNSAQYAGSPPIEARLTVDKLSRQLLKLQYNSTNQVETYSSQNVEQPVTLPTKTIPIAQLQQRVVESLQ